MISQHIAQERTSHTCSFRIFPRRFLLCVRSWKARRLPKNGLGLAERDLCRFRNSKHLRSRRKSAIAPHPVAIFLVSFTFTSHSQSGRSEPPSYIIMPSALINTPDKHFTNVAAHLKLCLLMLRVTCEQTEKRLAHTRCCLS